MHAVRYRDRYSDMQSTAAANLAAVKAHCARAQHNVMLIKAMQEEIRIIGRTSNNLDQIAMRMESICQLEQRIKGAK